MAEKFQKAIADFGKIKKTFVINQDRKSVLFLVITAIAAALSTVFVLYYAQLPKTRETESLLKIPTKEEILTQQQLKELDALREQAGIGSLTEEETKQQIEELEILREQAGIKPLSEEETQKQLEELELLRQHNN